MRGAVLTMVLVGCAPPMTSHRNPAYPDAVETTLLLTPTDCFESVEVASGGEHVRRATDFGALASQRYNLRWARIGEVAPGIPQGLCRELTSEQAEHPTTWNAPRMPDVVKDLFAMTDVASVLVPVVSNEIVCAEKGDAPWIWGEAAYEDERGLVDCHESHLTFSAFLYGRDGQLLWKAVHRHTLEGPPDPDELAWLLVQQAPIGEPFTLGLPKAGEPERLPGE